MGRHSHERKVQGLFQNPSLAKKTVFVQQGVNKKLASISAGQLRTMFPLDTATMSNEQVLAARERLLKSRNG